MYEKLKNARILHDVCSKSIFTLNLRVNALPCSPAVSYAYGILWFLLKEWGAYDSCFLYIATALLLSLYRSMSH